MADDELGVHDQSDPEEFRIATDWLRVYAQTYMPTDAPFSFAPEDLRSAGVSLVDLVHLFRVGVVVSAEKLDEPGAIWVVSGTDFDGRPLEAVVHIVSESMKVRLISIANLSEEKSDDAAA